MSYMGVLSMRSAPLMCRTGPSGVLRSIESSLTHESPMGLGRNGDRVANTPNRVFPPNRGGRTVGDQSSRTASENSQISQIWLNPSRPRRASGLRYSGLNTIVPLSSGTSPLCLGIPNFVGNPVLMVAIGTMHRMVIINSKGLR